MVEVLFSKLLHEVASNTHKPFDIGGKNDTAQRSELSTSARHMHSVVVQRGEESDLKESRMELQYREFRHIEIAILREARNGPENSPFRHGKNHRVARRQPAIFLSATTESSSVKSGLDISNVKVRHRRHPTVQRPLVELSRFD